MATWNQIAGDNLAAAGELRKRGWHRSSVSRAYYAAFAAVLQMLGKGGVRAGRRTAAHLALPKLIGRHCGKSRSSTARHLKASLRQLYERRIWADYDRIRSVDQAISLDAMRLAASIMKTCERI